MTELTPNTVPKIPWNIGLFRSGTNGIMMIITPEKMPAPPRPAMARPRIKAIEFGAAPQTTDPISNSATAIRNTLVGESTISLVQCCTQLVKGYLRHTFLPHKTCKFCRIRVETLPSLTDMLSHTNLYRLNCENLVLSVGWRYRWWFGRELPEIKRGKC